MRPQKNDQSTETHDDIVLPQLRRIKRNPLENSFYTLEHTDNHHHFFQRNLRPESPSAKVKTKNSFNINPMDRGSFVLITGGTAKEREKTYREMVDYRSLDKPFVHKFFGENDILICLSANPESIAHSRYNFNTSSGRVIDLTEKVSYWRSNIDAAPMITGDHQYSIKIFANKHGALVTFRLNDEEPKTYRGHYTSYRDGVLVIDDLPVTENDERRFINYDDHVNLIENNEAKKLSM